MTPISSLHTLTLDFPPSCIAFCPAEPEFFVVGTYHLHRNENDGQTDDDTVAEKAPQQRSGSLILFRLIGQTISNISTTETSGAVLDIQWRPHCPEESKETTNNVLAVATSVGAIEFHDLECHDTSATLVPSQRKKTLQVAEPSILVLSLTWHPSNPHTIGFTLSDGRVCLCTIHSAENASQTTTQIQEIYTHSLEAWTLSFSHNGSTILSGGDDAVFQCTDLSEDNSQHSPKWQDRGRTHMAGITAILPLTPNLVVTGSYDDHIRLFSNLSNGKKPLLETEKNLDGGVWRLKLLSSHQRGEESESNFTILASCMHAGSRIMQLSRRQHPDRHVGAGEEDDEGEWKFDILAKFEEHQSMNYGGDFQPLMISTSGASSSGSGGGERVRSIVSISFYDRLLCLWRVEFGAAASSSQGEV